MYTPFAVQLQKLHGVLSQNADFRPKVNSNRFKLKIQNLWCLSSFTGAVAPLGQSLCYVAYNFHDPKVKTRKPLKYMAYNFTDGVTHQSFIRTAFKAMKWHQHEMKHFTAFAAFFMTCWCLFDHLFLGSRVQQVSWYFFENILFTFRKIVLREANCSRWTVRIRKSFGF